MFSFSSIYAQIAAIYHKSTLFGKVKTELRIYGRPPDTQAIWVHWQSLIVSGFRFSGTLVQSFIRYLILSFSLPILCFLFECGGRSFNSTMSAILPASVYSYDSLLLPGFPPGWLLLADSSCLDTSAIVPLWYDTSIHLLRWWRAIIIG
jgi:hypothetical protein